MQTLFPDYSTTRLVTRAPPIIKAHPDNTFQTLFSPPIGAGSQNEGGLRTQGYFKRSLPNKPLITIITVIYNGAAHLEETIQSVIGQNYSNVEYIIVDGGSTDGTLEIIRRYEHAIDYWMSEQDTGIYDAMNKGVTLATGDWVNFMNADDFLFNHNVISNIVLEIKNQEHFFPVFYGKLYLINSKKEIVCTLGKHWRVAKNELKYRLSIAHQSAFTNRHAILKAGGFNTNYKISSDYELTLRLLCKSDAFFVENLVIAGMRIGGISSNPKNSLMIIKEYRSAQKANGYKYPHIYWILALSRIHIRNILWFFLGEKPTRRLLDISNGLLGRASYWSKH